MNNNEGTTWWAMGLDNSQFESDVAKSNNLFRSIGNTADTEGARIDSIFRKVTVAATGFFTAQQALSFANKMATVRGEFQKLEVAFETMLGNKEKADALMAQVVDVAARTPFDLQGVASGAKQLLAYGVGAEEVTDRLTQLGDIAAGLSIPLNDIVYLYGTTRVQGRLFTQDVRQFMGRGIPLVKELSKELGKTEEEINAMVTAGKIGFPEVQRVLDNMTQAGGQFYDLMDKQSRTISGKIANLGDAVETMFNNLGESQEGAINTVIDRASTIVENYESIGRILGELIVTYGVYKAALITISAVQKANSVVLRQAILEKRLAAAANITLSNAEATAAARTKLLTIAQSNLAKAFKASSVAALANPYVAVTAMVVGLGYATYKLLTYQTDAEKAQRKLNDSMREAEKSSLAEQRELAKLKGELEGTAKGTKEYNDIRDKIVSKFGQYHKNLKDEIDTVGILDGTYRKLSKSIELSFGARQYEKFRQSESDNLDEIMSKNLGKIQDKLLDKLGDEKGSEIYTKIRSAILKGADFSSDVEKALYEIQDKGTIWANTKVDSYIENIRHAQKVTDEFDKKARIKFGIIGSSTPESGKSPESPLFQNITKEIEEAKTKVQELQGAIADLRSGKTTSEDYKKDIEAKTEELEAAQKVLETLTGISKKELNRQAKELSTGVKAIRDELLKAKNGLESATTDEERIKYKTQIETYESELETILNKVALLGEKVVLNTIEGVIKGVNVEIGKFDTRTAQDKLFGTLDTSDLDKFRKGGNSGAKRSVSEWKDLRDVISKVDKELKDISETIGGTAGEFISLASEVTTGTLSMVNDITRLSELSSESISKGATLASKAVSAVEKASVILSIISAAIQIFQKLQDLLPDSHTQYLDFAEKIGEINKLRDAVNEYEEAVLRAKHAEEGWFATDNLRSLKQAREMHEEITRMINEKLNEDQAKYQNEEGGGWSTNPYKWFIKNTYGKIYGFGQDDNDIVKAKENLRIETRAATKGVLGSGWGAKSQKTENLVEWAKKTLGDDLFDDDNKLNLQVAETILNEYSDKLVGETKPTLEYLVKMQKKYDEYIEQLRDYVSSLYEPLVDNFVDSLWDWLDEGKSALDSFKEYASDTFRDIVSDMMRTIVLKEVMGDYDKNIADLYEQYASGKITEEELMQMVADRTGTLLDDAEKNMPVLERMMSNIDGMFKDNGIDLKDSSERREASNKGLAAASQDSVNELNGRATAIQGHTFQISEAMKELTTSMAAVLNYLSGIKDNTDSLEGISNTLKAMKEDISTMKDKGVIMR